MPQDLADDAIYLFLQKQKLNSLKLNSQPQTLTPVLLLFRSSLAVVKGFRVVVTGFRVVVTCTVPVVPVLLLFSQHLEAVWRGTWVHDRGLGLCLNPEPCITGS
jgi:hypothetical protein